MSRIKSLALGVALLVLPLGASAGNLESDHKAPEGAVVAAAEDAVIAPAAPTREAKQAKRTESRRRAPHGSRQSEAGFRFQNPYAFPVQTLPIAMPTVTNFSF
jgi:hypothetical protein